MLSVAAPAAPATCVARPARCACRSRGPPPARAGPPLGSSEALRGALADEYDAAAASYDEKWRSYTQATLACCLDALPPLPPDSSVLDLACGTGALLRSLRRRPGALARYTGLDNSAAMLAAAARAAESDEGASVATTWLRGGADEPLPLPDSSLDAVLCANSFHFFGAPLTTLAEAYRVLRPGGVLLIGDWSSDFLTCRLLEAFLRATGRPTSPVLTGDALLALLRTAAPRMEVLQLRRERLLTWWGFMVLVARKPLA